MKALRFAILALIASPVLVSCDDDNDYVAGPTVADDCPNVYFITNNLTYGLYTPVDIPSAIYIQINREDTNGQLTVPVNATLDPLLSAPESVTFEDGVDWAAYVITFNSTPEPGKTYTYSLSIPDEYVDFYKTKDGAGRLDGKIVIADEVSFTVYVQDMTSGYQNLFPPFNQKAYEVDTTHYVIPDFLGSGHTVTVYADYFGTIALSGESNYFYNYPSSSCAWINGPLYCGTTPGADDTFLYGMYIYYGTYSSWSDDISWWDGGHGFCLNSQFYYTTPTVWATDGYTGSDWGYVYFYINE